MLSYLHRVKVAWIRVHQIRPPQLDIDYLEHSKWLTRGGHRAAIFVYQCDLQVEWGIAFDWNFIFDYTWNTQNNTLNTFINNAELVTASKLFIFTSVVHEVGHNGDVIHVSLRSSIEQYGPMYTGVIEEIKVDILDKKPFRIPGEETISWTFSTNTHRNLLNNTYMMCK